MADSRPWIILTAGSRGDVQPYLALGLGLQRAGRLVRVHVEEWKCRADCAVIHLFLYGHYVCL